jgi:hypothetical protein
MVFTANKSTDAILLWEKNTVPWLISRAEHGRCGPMLKLYLLSYINLSPGFISFFWAKSSGFISGREQRHMRSNAEIVFCLCGPAAPVTLELRLPIFQVLWTDGRDADFVAQS